MSSTASCVEETSQSVLPLRTVSETPVRLPIPNYASGQGWHHTVTAIAIASAYGVHEMWRLPMSREVLVTLERIRRNQSSVWADERIRRVAHQALTNRGPHGTTGAFGQFLGHHFEYLDALDFNLRNAREGLTLVLKQHAHFPGYDADIRRNGQIVEAVQHKFGCKGISKAIAVLEQTHPGTAVRDVLRVPADQITKAVRVANGRITVAASNHTRATVETRATAGLTAISKRGTAAASLGRVTSRATVAGPRSAPPSVGFVTQRIYVPGRSAPLAS